MQVLVEGANAALLDIDFGISAAEVRCSITIWVTETKPFRHGFSTGLVLNFIFVHVIVIAAEEKGVVSHRQNTPNWLTRSTIDLHR